MKNLITIYVGTLLLLLSGCSENDEKFYNGTSGLYFALDQQNQDSMIYSFTATTENQIDLSVPVETMGYNTLGERQFQVVANEENTTAVAGKHYVALEKIYTLQQGMYRVKIPVHLLYDAELDTVIVRLSLELKMSDEFPDRLANRKKVLIIWSNMLPDVNPLIWKADYAFRFGVYSKVKHRYMLSVLKISELPDPDNDYQLDAYSKQMNNYFTEHRILDENGAVIEPWLK